MKLYLFFFNLLLYIKSQWSAGGHHIIDNSTNLSRTAIYTDTTHTVISLILHWCFTWCWGGEGCLVGCCSAERSTQSFRDGKEGCREREREMETISHFASFCQPLSGFRSSATEWRETNKSEKRQAAKGDMLPQESTCLVDLFLGTLCANYTISLCDEKQSSRCKVEKLFKFGVFPSAWAAGPPGVQLAPQD